MNRYERDPNYQKALVDPSAYFNDPGEMVACINLDREQKINLLRHWEMDARLMSVAKEENMGGGEPGRLGEVRRALLAMNEPENEHNSPTKAGG